MENRKFFDQNGYLSIPGMIVDPESLYAAPPLLPNGERVEGLWKYDRKGKFSIKEGKQVIGSFERYNIPIYRHLHYLVRKEVEEILNMDLLPTYYFDRFYYVGQELSKHRDREACEISVTLQISTNSSKPWPIWFETPDGKDVSVEMKNGDAVIYRGCERLHWREPLKGGRNTYHHQIFLHYVNAQGPFVHYAHDPGN